MTYSSVALSSLQNIYRPRRTAVAVNTREHEERLSPAIDYQALNDRVFKPKLADGDRAKSGKELIGMGN